MAIWDKLPMQLQKEGIRGMSRVAAREWGRIWNYRKYYMSIGYDRTIGKMG